MPIIALSIAGLDPSGGAGILADVEAFRAAGAHPLAVVSAITGQNSRGVSFSAPVDAETIVSQLAPLLEDFSIGAIKLGMLSNAATVRVIAKLLDSYAGPVVLDPVLASSSGRELLDIEGRAALLEWLLPRAALITPNLPELALLSGQSASEEGARFLIEKGARAVLVKGGHAEGPKADDLLVTPQGTQTFSLPRRGFPEQVALTRGTGCRLSSFLAARLAHGDALPEAVAGAKRWLWERWGEGVFRLGSGEAGYL